MNWACIQEVGNNLIHSSYCLRWFWLDRNVQMRRSFHGKSHKQSVHHFWEVWGPAHNRFRQC